MVVIVNARGSERINPYRGSILGIGQHAEQADNKSNTGCGQARSRTNVTCFTIVLPTPQPPPPT